VALAAVLGGYVSRSGPSRAKYILGGVRVRSIEVGGLNPTEAKSRLESSLPTPSKAEVEFVEDARRFAAAWPDLGIGYDYEATIANAVAVGRREPLTSRLRDRFALMTRGITVPVQYSCNTDATEAWFTALAAEIDEEPIDAGATWRNGGIELTPGKEGRKLDVKGMTTALINHSKRGRVPKQMAIAMRPSPPRVRRADLATLETVISRYSTPFNPARKSRTQNMKLAVQSIDGELIRPGETFSYNRCVGPRLERYGYLPAPIFSDDEVVQGVGGGICQVATTIYNTALFSGIEIVTRSHHSRPIDYAPRGRDATVYFGNTDLRFQNNTSLPIYIRVYIGGSRVYCDFYGSKSQEKKVSLQCTEDVRVEPIEERTDDPGIPEGEEVVDDEGRPGFRTTIVRTIGPSGPAGRERREVVSRDFYRPRTRKIRVGTSPATTAMPSDGSVKLPPSSHYGTAQSGSTGSPTAPKLPGAGGKPVPRKAPKSPGLRVEDLGSPSPPHR